MKIKNNKLKRYERKWVFNYVDYNQLCLLLYRSNFKFIDQFNDRYVNSIYLDDKNCSSIRQNIDGVNKKRKYRLRWYGGREIIKNPLLEVKEKEGFIVNKSILKINELNIMNLESSNSLGKIEEVINKKLNLINKIEPILTTHYLRSYFISSNKIVRATLDREIKSLPLYRKGNINLYKEFKEIILEIKYDTNLDSHVRENLKNITARLSKNSKFVNSAIFNAYSYS